MIKPNQKKVMLNEFEQDLEDSFEQLHSLSDSSKAETANSLKTAFYR